MGKEITTFNDIRTEEQKFYGYKKQFFKKMLILIKY